MAVIDRMRAHRVNWIVITAATLIFLIFVALSSFIRQAELDRLRNTVATYGEGLSARLEEKLNSRFAVVNLIRNALESEAVVNDATFAVTARSAVVLFEDIQALNFVNADGVIRQVVPLEGNEAALDLNLNALPKPSVALKDAAKMDRLVITAPITLAQGGQGFAGYLAVRHERVLSGYLNIVFRSRPLLDQLLRGTENFSIQVVDGDEVLFDMPYADGASAFANNQSFNVAGRSWTLTTYPRQTHMEQMQSNLDEFVIIIGAIFAGIVGIALHQAWRNKTQLMDREERFSLAMEGASDGIFDIDLRTGDAYYSPRWFEMLGYKRHELCVRPETFYNLLHPKDADQVLSMSEIVKKQEDQYDIEFRMRHKNGSWVNILSRARILRRNGKVVRMVGTHVDITELRQEQEKLREAASTDSLTGLRNRHYLSDQLLEVLASVSPSERLCLMHLDLDKFKSVNDQYGYDFGDGALRIVSERLSTSPVDFQIVARLGGDEFLIGYRAPFSNNEAAMVAEALIDSISAPFWCLDTALKVSACIGVAFAENQDDAKIDEIMSNAAMAAHEAKKAGSGGYAFFDQSMRKKRLNEVALSSEIKEALLKNEFQAFFQPQIDIKSNLIVGFEALARWHHPERGLMSAKDFVPIAENAYLINRIDNQIFTQACDALTAFDKEGFTELTVSVNLSTASLKDPLLVDVLREIFVTKSIDPKRVCIELLETTLLENAIGQAASNVWSLVEIGCQIDLDDFGTGHSAISSLHQFPISRIKIDRSFVKEVNENANLQVIGRSLIELGKGLNIKVLAEGVETSEELDFLLRSGCTHVQGYFIARPMPLGDLIEWVADWQAK